MSNIPLSDIQELLERSVFHRIRKVCVDKGYLPDITTYTKNEAGQIAYDIAISAIVTSKGFAIEVFSNSNQEVKDVKKLPRIVLNSQDFMPGALGGANTRYYEKQISGSYKKMVRPPQSSDYTFNVHLISETTKQARILNAIVALALPRMGYIPLYNDATRNVFTHVISSSDLTDQQNGINERVYRYEIPDIFETEDYSIEDIAAIKEITITPEVDGKITDSQVIT